MLQKIRSRCSWFWYKVFNQFLAIFFTTSILCQRFNIVAVHLFKSLTQNHEWFKIVWCIDFNCLFKASSFVLFLQGTKYALHLTKSFLPKPTNPKNIFFSIAFFFSIWVKLRVKTFTEKLTTDTHSLTEIYTNKESTKLYITKQKNSYVHTTAGIFKKLFTLRGLWVNKKKLNSHTSNWLITYICCLLCF